MADIELVIKIPEEMYAQIIDENCIDTMLIPYKDIVKNGTPLPKGHGRLIDETEIKKCGWNFIDHHAKTDAPTIIESDKAGSE